jgi:serine/threonine-protein kinase
MILGTPDYMAPEQAMGKPVDRRSDLFSAGSVFYEFLTGEKPFKGKTLHSVLYQIIQQEPEPVLTLNPELPVRLAAVVHRMLVKDPEARYGSLQDAGRDLQEIHVALRRSRSRSALPQPALASAEEARGRVRDHVARGRVHLDGGRLADARAELAEALALDPEAEDAVELVWRSVKQAAAARPSPPPLDVATERRVQMLLAKMSPGIMESDARSALAELALIAPDDPRVLEALRTRAGRGEAARERR